MQQKVTKKKLKNRNPRKSDLKIEMFSKLGKNRRKIQKHVLWAKWQRENRVECEIV